MASEGGGKVRTKQEHISPKPYEREKSILWRLTDSIKGVLRPSWLVGDTTTSDSTTPQQGVKPSTKNSENFEESQQLESRTMNSSQASDVSAENSPYLPSQRGTSVTSGNSSNLWSVSPDRNNCQQKTTVFSERQGQSHTAAASLWSNMSDSVDPCSYQKGKADSRAVLQSWNGASGAGSPSVFSTSSILSPHRTSLSAARSFNSSLSDRRHRAHGSQLADTPLKRQKVWTPEPSRKGRPLQHTPQVQPTFKPSVFSSGQQRSGHGMSTFGRRTSGHIPLNKSQNLNNSWSYQGSPSARATVTPRIVNSPRSAVLSSSTTKIFKTLERLSDTKRMRVGGSNSESLLSLTPTSYRKRPRPLHSVASPSVKIPSSSIKTTAAVESTPGVSTPSAIVSTPCAVVSTPSAVVSTPSTVLPVPPLAAPPVTAPEEKEEEDIVVLDELSDDDGDEDSDDIQIIEDEDPKGKQSSPATKPTISSPFKTDVKNTHLFEKYPSQMDRKVTNPVTQTQPVVGHQSPVVSASPFSTPTFTPPAWGSTAPKPKSIVTGVGKSGSSGNKSVNGTDTDSMTAGSPVKPITELKQGSVMDILGKSPTTSSSSPFKTGSPLKQGGLGDKGSSATMEPKGGLAFSSLVSSSSSTASPFLAQSSSSSTASPFLAQSSSSSMASPFLAQSSIHQTSLGGFKFGSSAAAGGSTLTSQGKQSSGNEGFRFGASTGTVGIKLMSEEKQVPETGGFKFETSSPAGTGGITLTSKNSSSTGGFKLGASPAGTGSITLTSKDSSTTGGLKFGAGPAGAVDSKLSSSPSEEKDSSGTGGFKIGTSTTTSSFSLFTGGPKQGTLASESGGFSGSGNFTFGMTNPLSSNKVSDSGFKFGSKSNELGAASNPMSSNKVSDSGFKFGSKSNELGAALANAKSPVPCISSETSSHSPGKSIFSNTSNTGFVFGSASSAGITSTPSPQVSNRSSQSTVDKQGTMFQAPPAQSQASNSSTSVLFDSEETNKSDSTGSFSTNKTNKSEHAASLFTASNSINSTSGSFQFGKSQSSSLFSFDSNKTSNKDSSGTGQTKETDSKSQHSFKFAGESKTEQTSPSQTDSASKSGVNLFASSSPNSKGFVFGAPSFGNGTSSSISSSNASTLFSSPASSLSKTAVNEESHFGGKPAVSSTPPSGFSFGTSTMASSKPTMDSVSKCSSPSDNGSSSPSPSQQNGLTFGSESNAASSTERPSVPLSVFGAGSGATSTSSFCAVGSGPQGNAAAASPLAAPVSTSNQGFKFTEAKSSTFSFGTGSSSSSTSQFQFALPKSVTTSSQDSGSSGFTFGQTASTPATDNSVPAPVFAAPASLGFAPVSENKAFSLGTGDGPRQVKRAVRRIPRK